MRRRQLLAGLAGVGLVPQGHAQDTPWPDRPIRIVVGAAPGGTTDIVARVIASSLSARLGQPIMIDNRAGAGGNIGADVVAKAEADGYTLLLTPPGPLTINAAIYPNLPFDPEKAFAPVSLVCSALDILCVPLSKPWNNVGELIADARARPGAISFATSGVGSPSHISVVLLQSLTEIDVVYVPYRGGGPLITDFLAGRLDASIGPGPSFMPLINSGRIRALGVATTSRSPLLPDVPTLGETVPGYEFSTWLGLVAPARTPAPVIAKVHAMVAATLNEPVVRERLIEQGATPSLMDSAEFGTFVKRESEKWARIAKAMNVKIE